ncbi:MAG TPA: 3-phosphoshikimate 1-carboxyvinyltransferase [Gemmatimonadales bacterium]|nr:3-phosphoshikimate 1-carboxyvinyltransferase [Gemmatimonadales bacterium]
MAGTVRAPGDKSITHRALLLAALGRGVSHVGGALTSLDARSSARVLRQLGAEISPLREGDVLAIKGRGRFRAPDRTLDCGNSGTTTRLLLGLLAGHRFRATLTGDASLRRRPMRRVTVPLTEMGARFEERGGDGLPLTVRGGKLRPIRYAMPVSSAQVKSSLLLAGMVGEVSVDLLEPNGRSRDHTERMLRALGFAVGERDGWIEFRPGGRVEPFDIQVPGDPSSAAFLVGASVLAEAGELRIAGVGVNPTRTGFLRVLERMGAQVAVQASDTSFGEPVADLITRPAALRRTEVSAGEIPGLIDEIPMLAVLASRAAGETVFRDVGELRVKESDRLGLIAGNIRAVGGKAEVRGDDLHVEGVESPPRGRVRTAADHRIAMAFAVLGTLPGARIAIDDMACTAVSFPRFPETLRRIGAGRSR